MHNAHEGPVGLVLVTQQQPHLPHVQPECLPGQGGQLVGLVVPVLDQAPGADHHGPLYGGLAVRGSA